MIPLYQKIDTGTDYATRWTLNPFALYLLNCGWQTGVFVYPGPEETLRLVKSWTKDKK